MGGLIVMEISFDLTMLRLFEKACLEAKLWNMYLQMTDYILA